MSGVEGDVEYRQYGFDQDQRLLGFIEAISGYFFLVPEQLTIEGMTCRSCEVRLEKAIGKISGVTSVNASSARGRVRVETSRTIPKASYARAVEKAGYKLGKTRPWITTDRTVWRDLAIGIGIVALLAVLVSRLGLDTLTAGAGESFATGGLILVIGLGVAAGFSTCMAMVGGLVLAVSAKYNEARAESTIAKRLRPQLVFNLGRVVGFTILGGAIGALGSMFSLSGTALAIAMIVVAIVMTLLSLQLTQISPRLSALSLTLPTRWTKGLANKTTGEEESKEAPSGGARDLRTALLGGATFFLPCGFTQAVQIYALSTGSALSGALTMMFFALGTVPGLLAIGGLASSVRGTIATTFFRVAGVAVLAFAVVNFTAGMNVLAPGASLAGLFGAGTTAEATTISENVTIVDGVQHITLTHGPGGYLPEESVIYQGVPSKLEITSTTFDCGLSFAAPELGTPSVMLNMEKPTTIDFTPKEPGILNFGCSMGMITGTFNVIKESAGAGSAA